MNVTVSLSNDENGRSPTKDVPIIMICGLDLDMLLNDFRQVLIAQAISLPKEFCFLAGCGFPVLTAQEMHVRLSCVISKENRVRIRPTYEKPRLGIRIEDKIYGFVFCSHSSDLSSLRDAIQVQLGDVVDVFGQRERGYRFVDANKWPITYEQEKHFSVIQIIHDSCVHLMPDDARYSRCLTNTDCVDALPAQSAIARYSSKPLCRELTFRRCKDKERNVTTSHATSTRQILLSYVRAEAANHALRLKLELVKHGYSVYLDVHEIKSGEDWQDALNTAVSNCQAFVPLVTSRYGETMWTNREVKLADVLSKPIIPVSYLTYWPPRSLAIQFATTQFIYWRPLADVKLDSGNDDTVDISLWSPNDVSAVATRIANRILLDSGNGNNDNSTTSKQSPTGSLRKAGTLRSCPAKLPQAFKSLSQNRDGRQLIVISVHPKQKQFALKMQACLQRAQYEVWCSVQDDEIDSDSQVLSQDSNSNNILDTSFQDSHARLSQPNAAHEQQQHDQQPRCSLQFRERADDAAVVVVVLSSSSAVSRRCRQQLFYCEQRKKLLAVMFEDFRMPAWMSNLIGTTQVLQNVDSSHFDECLKARISQLIGNRVVDNTELYRTMITQAAAELRTKMPVASYVYISGGTQFYHSDSAAICRALGRCLAALDDVHVVTGGFYGVGATVAEAYDAARKARNLESNLWHILPLKDDQDRSIRGPQRADKTFGCCSTGQTLLCGESVRQREDVVSQLFPVCVLVEGGPGAAHEADQFFWNDAIVVPVMCTGGAANGMFNLPEKIFQVPVGVNSDDWQQLKSPSRGADVIAQAVRRIVEQLCHKRTALTRALSGERDALKSLLGVEPEPSALSRGQRAATLSPLSSSSGGGHSDVSAILFDDNDVAPVDVAITGRKPTAAAAANAEIPTRDVTVPRLDRADTIKVSKYSATQQNDAAQADSDNSFGFDALPEPNCVTSASSLSVTSSIVTQGVNFENSFTSLKSNTQPAAVTRDSRRQCERLVRTTSPNPVKLRGSKTLLAQRANTVGAGAAKRTRRQVKCELNFINSQQQQQQQQQQQAEKRVKLPPPTKRA